MLFGLASLSENLGVNWFSSYNWPLNFQSLSLDNFQNKTDKITVYPNPFLEKITVSVKEKTDANIKIFDVSGKLIVATKMKNLSETIYFPKVSVVHGYESGANKSIKFFLIFVNSAITYFNKWGWFFDSERNKINKKTLSQFK